jgi:hypothetical protein
VLSYWVGKVFFFTISYLIIHPSLLSSNIRNGKVPHEQQLTAGLRRYEITMILVNSDRYMIYVQ